MKSLAFCMAVLWLWHKHKTLHPKNFLFLKRIKSAIKLWYANIWESVLKIKHFETIINRVGPFLFGINLLMIYILLTKEYHLCHFSSDLYKHLEMNVTCKHGKHQFNLMWILLLFFFLQLGKNPSVLNNFQQNYQKRGL